MVPKVRIEGNYHMQGRILVIPLNGHGKCFFEPSKSHDLILFLTEMFFKWKEKCGGGTLSWLILTNNFNAIITTLIHNNTANEFLISLNSAQIDHLHWKNFGQYSICWYYPCIAFLSVKSFIFHTLIHISQYLNREHGHYVEDKNASLWKKWSHFLQHHGHQCRLYNKRIEVETWQSIWRCQSSRYGYSCRLILDLIRSVQHIIYYILVSISFQ